MNSRDHHPIEAIHALVDGRLDVLEREAVERHIETCASCRAERDVAESTRRILRQAVPDPDLPPGTYYLKIYWERVGWTIEIFPPFES